jgi:hypothetical protein
VLLVSVERKGEREFFRVLLQPSVDVTQVRPRLTTTEGEYLPLPGGLSPQVAVSADLEELVVLRGSSGPTSEMERLTIEGPVIAESRLSGDAEAFYPRYAPDQHSIVTVEMRFGGGRCTPRGAWC